MVKINTSELNFSPTKNSVFIKVLIKICFLPITIEGNERRISFKLLSKKSLAHVIIYYGFYSLISLSSMSVFDSELLTKISQQNKLETFSVFSVAISSLSLIFPLVLARGLDRIDFQRVWEENLSFPKHGAKTIISFIGIIIGAVAAMFGYLINVQFPVEDTAKIFSMSILGKGPFTNDVLG